MRRWKAWEKEIITLDYQFSHGEFFSFLQSIRLKSDDLNRVIKGTSWVRILSSNIKSADEEYLEVGNALRSVRKLFLSPGSYVLSVWFMQILQGSD
jgi:hypothetical protein